MVAAQNAPVGLRARRILLVEDNWDVARACRNILTLRGHQVFVANSGAEALAIAEVEPLDVVLYCAADPNNPPPKGPPKKLSRLARLV